MPIAQDMKNLTENIEVAYGERATWLGETMKATHQLINRFHHEHKGMADNLGAFLDNSESTRIAAFKKTLSSIQSRQREREEEVASLIKKFDDELAEMARQLKSFLNQSESSRLTEFKKILIDIKGKQRSRQEEERSRQKEVGRLMIAFQRDTSEARGHWQNLAKIMASKRTGRRVPITEVPKKAHVAKRVEKAAQEAFGEGDLKARTWTTIEANPQGISLGQIGKELKVPYIRLAKSIRELVEKGKVAKRDSQYFPA